MRDERETNVWEGEKKMTSSKHKEDDLPQEEATKTTKRRKYDLLEEGWGEDRRRNPTTLPTSPTKEGCQ